MPLTTFTDRHIVRLLATETRRSDSSPHVLSQSHVALGRFLAGELVDHLSLETCEIQHPQGARSGWRIVDEDRVALVCLLRAGLYVTEGVREVLTRAPLLHASPKRGAGLSQTELAELMRTSAHTAVLIDSVVNTGSTLEPVLKQLAQQGLRVFVLALVGPTTTAARLATDWPGVRFLFARTSENQYVGSGSTDTGNRLFGTYGKSGGDQPKDG